MSKGPFRYRLLEPGEWYRLDDVIEGEFLPPPETAAVAIAEDAAGQIQGLLMLQLQLHMEPLLILHPDVNFRRLHGVLEAALADRKGVCYFAFVPNEKIARMAELVGMTPTTYRVWKKEVV